MGTTFNFRPKRLEKLTKSEKADLMFDLISAFSIVRNPLDTALFLQDLLTASEIRNISLRLRIAKLLFDGRTYKEIIDLTHVSNATITKVSIWLNRGGEGFKKVVKRLPIKRKMPKELPPIPVEFQMPQVLLALAQYKLAKDQQKGLESIIDNVDQKKYLDKEIREMFKEIYSSKKRRKSF